MFVEIPRLLDGPIPHRLIRADSLNNHRWQETEAKFLSAGSSDSLPPQDRWKTSLPPGQNTTAPRPRHI